MNLNGEFLLRLEYDIDYACPMQAKRIHIKMRSLCVAVDFLKQSYKTWIGFYLAGMFRLSMSPLLIFCGSKLIAYYIDYRCGIKEPP